jgi:MFS transporter, DHA2 family, multidrug resistance protein
VSTTAAPRATRREWIGLAVIALPCLLYSMDLTVLNLAVPRLTEDLAPSSVQLLWIMDIYGFMVAGALQLTSAIGAGIVLAMAVGAAVVPRGAPTGGEVDGEGEAGLLVSNE